MDNNNQRQMLATLHQNYKQVTYLWHWF